MYRSNSRMLLTISGLVLSVIILMVGMIISETYLESQQYYIQPYKNNNAVILESDIDYKTYEYYKVNSEYNVGLEIYTNYLYNLKTYEKDGCITKIHGNCVKIDENANLNYWSNGEDISSRYSTKLLSGRLINKEDIYNEEKVTVIDSALAEALFGTKEAVGKEIKFSVMIEGELSGYESFKVIGVVEASDYTNEQLSSIKEKYMADTTEMFGKDETMYIFNFYIPYSINIGNYDVSDFKMDLIFTSQTDSYRDITSEVREASMKNNYINIDSIVNADIMYEKYAADIKASQKTILYVVLFVFLVSGLSIMNTMMFSVKERINEIGVRKAIGAFNVDIIGQFIFEGFVYGVIGSIIGVILAIIISSHIFILLNGNLFNIECLVVSKEAILLSISASILVGVLASIIPAIYASHIKVADALRFD